MADTKISALTALTNAELASDDVLPIVDTGATATKKITVAQLFGDTANGVVYLNGSKVATSGSGLTFDGTNLGVGTGSPASSLEISDAVSGGAAVSLNLRNSLEAVDSSTSLYFSTGSGALGKENITGIIRSTVTQANPSTLVSDLRFFTNAGDVISERLRIDSSGNVGIGTSSPSEALTVRGQVFLETNSTAADSGQGLFWQSTTNGWTTSAAHAAIYGKRVDALNGYLRFDTRGSGTTTERLRIDSSGNLLVGTTSTSFTTTAGTVCGGNYLAVTRSNDTPLFLGRLNGDGSIANFRRDATIVGSISVTTTATSYNTSSDYRLKENVAPMQNALATVAQLNPVTYTWKADGSAGQGFIAHELQAVVPDAVTGEKDAVDEDGNPQYQGVDTSFLVATLTKAIQELNAKVEALEAQLNLGA